MPKPMPKDWEIEFSKPDLEGFTMAEYTEKVILYGFLMVMIGVPRCSINIKIFESDVVYFQPHLEKWRLHLARHRVVR